MKIIYSSKLDSIGFSASFICAIHCALMPILFATLTLTPLSFLANPKFEEIVILISLIIAILSLSSSFRHHKSLIPLFTAIFGFIIIFTSHFFEYKESILTPIGAFTVAFSHLVNFKYYRKCSCNRM